MELGGQRHKLLYGATKMRCGDKQADLYLNSMVVSRRDVVFRRPVGNAYESGRGASQSRLDVAVA